ncbi:MAG: hypothetical protein LBV51_00985 [Acholeplasmatales bacterium]|jgi:hypothetical protein|nr:hypothetical protein [Acholeplasmatales bacterium]
MFKNVKTEPICVQVLPDGNNIYIHEFNEEASYNTYTARGMFYSWASDGKDYRLFVDKDYYVALADLFTLEANISFTDHLKRLIKYNLINKIVTYSMFGLVFVYLIVMFIINSSTSNSIQSNYLLFPVIGCLVVSLGMSFAFRTPQKKSLDKYRKEMQDLLGSDGINNLMNCQTEFSKAYYDKAHPAVIEEEIVENDIVDIEKTESNPEEASLDEKENKDANEEKNTEEEDEIK